MRKINVHPDPSKDFFVFQFEHQIEKEYIMIYYISGKMVDYDISEYGDIQFMIRHNLHPGFNLMLVRDSENYYSHKLIIEYQGKLNINLSNLDQNEAARCNLWIHIWMYLYHQG